MSLFDAASASRSFVVDSPVGLRSSATSFKGSFSAVLNRNLKR